MAKKVTKTQAKKAAKAAKKHPVAVIIIVGLLLMLVIAAVVLYFVKPDLYHKYLGVGGHAYTEWETTEASCNKDGVKTRYCTVCGEEESEVIPATHAHAYGEWQTTEPTCGEDGKRERVCSVCYDKQVEIIPATGKHIMGPDNVCTVCGYNPNAPAISDVEVHFLELGNKNSGDCTLIKCGDTEVLIDAGSKRNSTKTVKDYIDKYCTDGKLEYVVATHAHEDHIAALAGEENKNNGVLYSYEIGTIITYAGHKTTSKIYNDFEKAVTYAVSQGAIRYTAKECWYEQNGAKKQYFLDDKELVSFNVLYQKYYDQTTSNENNYSVCTLLSQKINKNDTYHYLFTGDLEKGGEESLAQNNKLPKCKLFKGGHHGSSTSSNDVLLSKIQPENIAICTCAGTYEYADKPNTKPNYLPEETAKLNTFPTQEAIDRMAKYTDKIYVTTMGVLGSDYSTSDFKPMNGNIVFYTEKGELKLRCSNNTTILKDTEWFKENRTWNGV